MVWPTRPRLSAAGFSDGEIDKVVWSNPVAFYGQSGRLELDEVGPDAMATFEGNSILRGERVA